MITSTPAAAPRTGPDETPFHDRVLPDRVLPEHLARTAVRGAAVTGGGQAVRLAIGLGATAILARLLTPGDYGLVAMTVVVTGFVQVFRDAGLTSAMIQRREITHGQVSSLFWLNLALGCLLAGILVAMSPWVAAFYGEPKLGPITRALALTFVLGGLTLQHQALLRRQMRFPALVTLEIVSAAVGAVVAIAMALRGFEYWSLVGMAIGTAAANAIGVWIAVPWRPGPPRRGSGTRSLVKFGSDVLAFDVVNYFARQADNLLIGWYWGPAALGLYDRAYGLMMLPLNQVNAPLAAVAVPVLSRARTDSAKFGRFVLSALQLLASATIPMVAAIVVFADEIVLLGLGPGWTEVAHLFRLLAVAAAGRAISNTVGWVLISLGHTKK
jgi:PST family polysaccharide transporter